MMSYRLLYSAQTYVLCRVTKLTFAMVGLN
jgi:hypothetical protein